MGDLTPKVFSTVLEPVAAFLVAEWASVRTATGTDRLYALRFTGWVALVELAIAAVMALLLASWMRPDGSGRLPKLLPAIAMGIATGLAAAFMLSNGFPPTTCFPRP